MLPPGEKTGGMTLPPATEVVRLYGICAKRNDALIGEVRKAQGKRAD